MHVRILALTSLSPRAKAGICFMANENCKLPNTLGICFLDLHGEYDFSEIIKWCEEVVLPVG